MTTTLARKTPFSLLAALCPFGKAWGSLFLDDGEQVELSSFLSVSYVVQVKFCTSACFSLVEILPILAVKWKLC